MIYQVMTVRDLKAENFSPPFFCKSKGEAIRMFTDQVNSKDPNSLLAKHPEDFILYHVGEFDDFSGTFASQLPVHVLHGSEGVQAPEGRVFGKPPPNGAAELQGLVQHDFRR